MEFKEIEKSVLKAAYDYSEKYKIGFDADFALHKLYEEMGELSEAFLTYKKKSRPEKYISEEDASKKLAYELADVVGITMLLAKELDIDLENAVKDKWITRDWEKNKNNLE